jgi:hypothetical protein
MMAVIQGMCARIGMVTGVGLSTTMRRRLPAWLLYPLGLSVILANTINAGADLEGMDAGAQLVFGLPRIALIALFGAILIVIQAFLSYRLFSSIVKWLTVTLFAYVITAFVVHPPWATVLRHLVVPEIHVNSAWLTTLVAVLGTTITPYFFLWQAALEVEEEKQLGRQSEKSPKGATNQEIKDVHADVNGAWSFQISSPFLLLSPPPQRWELMVSTILPRHRTPRARWSHSREGSHRGCSPLVWWERACWQYRRWWPLPRTSWSAASGSARASTESQRALRNFTARSSPA